MKAMDKIKLKEARLWMGLKQKDMGLLLGMPRAAYTKIETERCRRKPTKQHTISVFILKYLYSEGLLQMVLNQIKLHN